MTQDEIIEMARQAQVHEELCGEHFIYEFAKLIAAAAASKEREACAQICEQYSDTDTYQGGITTEFHAIMIRKRGEE